MTSKQNITALAYDKRGRLISVGKNSYIKTHPLQQSYAVKAGVPYKIYIHAEIDALVKAKGKTVHKIVVVRMNSKGAYLNAKPCPSCEMALKDFGVKIIEHT